MAESRCFNVLTRTNAGSNRFLVEHAQSKWTLPQGARLDERETELEGFQVGWSSNGHQLERPKNDLEMCHLQANLTSKNLPRPEIDHTYMCAADLELAIVERDLDLSSNHGNTCAHSRPNCAPRADSTRTKNLRATRQVSRHKKKKDIQNRVASRDNELVLLSIRKRPNCPRQLECPAQFQLHPHDCASCEHGAEVVRATDHSNNSTTASRR